MGSTQPLAIFHYVESYPLIPTFVDGLAHVEIVGDSMRLAFYVEQRNVWNREAERVIVARLIAPVAGVTLALPVIMRALPPVLAGEVLRARLVS